MIYPTLVLAMIGGWEILLVLVVLGFLLMGVTAVIGVIYYAVRSSRKDNHPQSSPTPPGQS